MRLDRLCLQLYAPLPVTLQANPWRCAELSNLHPLPVLAEPQGYICSSSSGEVVYRVDHRRNLQLPGIEVL